MESASIIFRRTAIRRDSPNGVKKWGRLLTRNSIKRIVLRDLGQQVANWIDVMESGNNPLIIALSGIHDSPTHIRSYAYANVSLPECIKSMPAPNVIIRQRVPKRQEIFVENILMKNRALLDSEDIPMRRRGSFQKVIFSKRLISGTAKPPYRQTSIFVRVGALNKLNVCQT